MEIGARQMLCCVQPAQTSEHEALLGEYPQSTNEVSNAIETYLPYYEPTRAPAGTLATKHRGCLQGSSVLDDALKAAAMFVKQFKA